MPQSLINRFFFEKREAENLEDFMHTSLRFEALLYNRHEDVHTNRDPDLGLDRILGGAIESLYPQMLLDPLEEKLHPPSALVKWRDDRREEIEIVGQKDEPPAGIGVFVANPADRHGIELSGQWASRTNNLIGAKTGRWIDRHGLQSPEGEPLLGTRYKKGMPLVESIEPREVDVCLVHDVETARLQGELIEDGYLVNLAMRDHDEAGNIAAQIEQRMQFDCCFVLSKWCPGKQGKTQVDRGRIEGIDRLVESHAEAVAGIQPSSGPNESLSQICPDAPVSLFVGFGQGVSRDVAAQPCMVQFVLQCPEAGFDVAEAFPVGQLCKSHADKLVFATEATDSILAVVARNAPAEFVTRQEFEKLREDELSGVHQPLLSVPRSGRKGQKLRDSSSRARSFFAISNA